MSRYYRWALGVRCPGCASTAIVSVTSGADEDKFERMPEGFKVVKAEGSDKIYCIACNQPSIMLHIDR